MWPRKANLEDFTLQQTAKQHFADARAYTQCPYRVQLPKKLFNNFIVCIKRCYVYFIRSFIYFLTGACREHAIARLVTSHVPKAEKARRHGRELSFILPHNAVNNFAPLFQAIEQEINNRTSRLGKNI